MFTKSGFIAKQSTESSKLTGLFKCDRLLMRAYADEGDHTDPDTNNDGATQVNFETLIANARKEEKDKLYPRIKKLEDENKALVQTNNENLIKIGTLQKELDEEKAKAKGGESARVKDLEAQLATAQAEIKTLKETAPNEAEIRQRIEAEYEVKMYRTTKLSENPDSILAVFADEVTGSTKEEIDASFSRAVEKTVQTKKQLGLLDDEGKPVKPPKAGKPATPPAVNPKSEDEDKFDLDYIQNLDPRSKEYADFRKKMGLK